MRFTGFLLIMLLVLTSLFPWHLAAADDCDEAEKWYE
jgi:hypothetical protein